jgi:dTDP-4-dehydrorhamnose reductase
MRVLVFGKTGQVGMGLAAALSRRHDATVVGREAADLAVPRTAVALVRSMRPDAVINAAAYTAVDKAESDPAMANLVNAEAPGMMARAAAEVGALFVQYSTDYVFRGDAQAPYREDDPTDPQSEYGRSKLAGEHAVREANDEHLILRTSWVYSNDGRNFLNTMLRLAEDNSELRVVDDQLGTPTYARSLSAATVAILDWLTDHPRSRLQAMGTYHVTCSGVASWHGFASEIMRLTGNDQVAVSPISTREWPTPAKRPAFSVLDNSKLMERFGISLASWQEALRHCLEQRAESADQQ